jgi:NADH-quinone oxidoreductase subunit J
MMLDINLDVLREGFWGNLPLAVIVGILMAGEMVLLLVRGFGGETVISPGAPPRGFSNTKALGQVIYTDYVFAFEIAAIILLVAIVAAIAITLRHRKETKYQDPSVQLNVRASDRLRIVKMAPEGPNVGPSPVHPPVDTAGAPPKP